MNQEHKNITQQTITIAREAIDLALAYSGGDSETAQELEAQLDDICRHSDARLIASAPDLLRALENLLSTQIDPMGIKASHARREAYEVIAKAKGQE